MQNRSLGATTLAFSSVMIGLYAQFAAVALILTGAVFSPSGSVYAAASFALGGLFFGLTFAAYFLAYGYWTRKSWSWAGGIALLVTLLVASVVLSIISTNLTSTVLPLAGAVVGVWFLNRPAIKAELLGTDAPAAVITTPSGVGAAELAH
ncbi:MAG: hypothetical protein AB1Z67_09875 [Candidatus Limnocylindrales bacterium]